MRLLSVILLVLIVVVSAGLTLAQEPPAFTYYRLPEPNDSSASRAHAVAVDDSGTVLVGGEARVEVVMGAYLIMCCDPEIYAMPTADSSVASRVNCIATPKGQTWMLPWCAGSWDGGPGGGPLPIVWYDSTANDSMDFEYVLLPTMGGSGTGEVRGFCDSLGGAIEAICVGWSTPSGGVRHAVGWSSDRPFGGGYTLEVMGDYGPGLRSQANDVIADSDTTRLAVGWAVTSGGLMLPQRWWRDAQGTWTRALMPLPLGAVEGGVNSILGQQGNEVMAAAGWCMDSFDETHAALWTKADEMSPWVAEGLDTLDGYDESNGLGAAILGQQGNEIYVAGTSYTGEDSVATLWILGQQGNEIYDLNNLVRNEDSLDLSLRIATSVDWIPGDADEEVVICGWGVEIGGMSPLTSPADPHAFLLIEEPGAASVSGPRADAANLNLYTSPNPFSSGVRASYAVGRTMPVRLAVYDVEGRLVRVLTEGLEAAGDHTATWDGVDSNGRRAGSGIYFMRLEAGNRAVSRKAVFLR